jgi:flavin-dependent dehydrogenase
MEKASPEERLIDLAIIGGGPAGAATAIEARRRGLSVTIWERDRFPRDKVCGEFISAESLPLLGDKIPAELAKGAVIRDSEFISSRGRVGGFALPRPGRGLSRRVLDEALWKAAARAGARVREGETVRRLRRLSRAKMLRTGCDRPGDWEIEAAGRATETARELVIACGRWWNLEGFPSPARGTKTPAGGPWVGAKAHFKGVAPRAAVEMYYFPGGYCGLAPMEDGLYNACCLVHRRLARNTGGIDDFAGWLKTVARHGALDARLWGAIQVSDTVATAPLRPARRRAECDGALLVGDAAGFLDPFTGDGISMALHSGGLAAAESARRVGHAVAEPMACSYSQQLGRAVRRSYRVAGLLRVLVRAPSVVQALAAAALPWLGARLHAETRWRS